MEVHRKRDGSRKHPAQTRKALPRMKGDLERFLRKSRKRYGVDGKIVLGAFISCTGKLPANPALIYSHIRSCSECREEIEGEKPDD